MHGRIGAGAFLFVAFCGFVLVHTALLEPALPSLQADEVWLDGTRLEVAVAGVAPSGLVTIEIDTLRADTVGSRTPLLDLMLNAQVHKGLFGLDGSSSVQGAFFTVRHESVGAAATSTTPAIPEHMEVVARIKSLPLAELRRFVGGRLGELHCPDLHFEIRARAPEADPLVLARPGDDEVRRSLQFLLAPVGTAPESG